MELFEYDKDFILDWFRESGEASFMKFLDEFYTDVITYDYYLITETQ